VFAACAQSPDEQYVRIYQIIQEADRLNDAGQARAAAAKYVEAQEALTRFRGVYPGWNERVINYRLNYVTTKLAPLSGSLAAGTTPTPGTTGTNGPLGAASSAPPVTNAAAPPLPSNTAVAMSAEFDNQIKALQAEVTRLQTDNQRLSAKLKEALSVQPATIDPRELAKAEDRIRSLLKENELFKTQLAQRSTNPAAASPDLSAKVAEQTEVIAALRAENEVLKKQSAEWRGKYEVAQSDSTKAPPADVQAAVRRLTEENVSLTKQVALWKEVAQSNQRQTSLAHIPSMPSDAQRELLALRARVQTLEASPVPYTPEELALFNKPPPTLVANVTATSPRPNTPPPSEGPLVKPAANVTRGVPTGAGVLVRTAERAFATGHYQEAQQKYVEVLQQEPNNITMLCNLASAQLELGDIPEAEKNVQRARELDPNDYFALYLLGRIRFRQEKLDESLEALSRSVKANPDYADTQNYLGIVLSEKGLRGPAEAALRKAIQLQPNNAVAHNNLAIVYATQTPPALALARWHYKKALDAGHPPNAELEKLLRQ
jgi:tetratricopeptide (TPR) repeat protein